MRSAANPAIVGLLAAIPTAFDCAAWHAKARSAGLTLSDLLRRSIGRVRTWTVAHAEVERERTRELARLGNNLNRLPLATRPVSTSGSEPYRARTRTANSWAA